MKALLIHLGVTPPKTHDLGALEALLTPVCPAWSWAAQDLRFLTRASVDRNAESRTGKKTSSFWFFLCASASPCFKKRKLRICQKSLTNVVPGCDTIPILLTHGWVILGPLKPGGA
jgi:hypothetical protein